ncbi:MAG TPA: uroporphyrinogen-III synthase [Oligoflexia bacterium]|nr:uroporphyrinogen-III synthase [Oligoflexia bacterium]HMR24801.1 uroporphyrinogen-III synthase [Oligoflexia bacterium]
MNKIEIIFTGAVDEQSIDKILKSYPDVEIKQFNLLKFSKVINNKNLKKYYDAASSSSIVCITSKKTIEIIKQYKDLIDIVSQKKIIVSGEKVASFLKKEINAEVFFSKQLQGQNGVIDVLSKIATDKDSILYLHSNKAEEKISRFLKSGKFTGHCKVVYETDIDDLSSIELLNYLNENNDNNKVIFFASPSAVHAYQDKILSSYEKKINYIAFGQSTKDVCETYKIDCFNDSGCKSYVDLITQFLIEKLLIY